MTGADVGTVYLVGAGPGDPRLLTLRAAELLAAADVVLYDALVHTDILRHCRADAHCAYVGKRAGRPGHRQASIHQSLLEHARSGAAVVRLKGGDPFLFGRGSEEAEFLAEHGVPFEVVPGVPSPLAATAYAGISLTHRDLGSSVAYLTATESTEKDRSSHDWVRLAQGPQTLVIFMGLRKLESLMELLIEHGRTPDTPAAVIASASLPGQKVVVATVATIAERVRQAGIGMPALTVVGAVVALREKLRWFDNTPLFGKRVLVTRPLEDAHELGALLRAQGAEPLYVPMVTIAAPSDPEPLASAVRNAREYAWLIFTSRNGVRAFVNELHRQHKDARALAGCRIAAVGPKTVAALAEYGLRADLVPVEYRGEALAQALRETLGSSLDGVKMLLPRARVAREVLPDTLRRHGAEVRVIEAYQNTGAPPKSAQRARELVRTRAVDVLTFTAASAATNFADALGEELLPSARVLTTASIGPITSAAAGTVGLPPQVTANRYTSESLVQALTGYFAAQQANQQANEQAEEPSGGAS